jgi:hypothetical protein
LQGKVLFLDFMEIIDLKDENGEARGTRVVFGVPV